MILTWVDGLCFGILLLSIGAIIHSYFLYPLSWRFRHTAPLPALAEPRTWPRVSIIIAAYNEAGVIADRVRNLLATDYPPELLEIFIASDGSADHTVTQARSAAAGDPRVIVLDCHQRRGKVGVLNDVCDQASGDILVFSDANVTFEPDAIRVLVQALQDPSVGTVCGKLRFRALDGKLSAQSEGLYWKLESWLKEQEGRRGVLLGANGAIYALRKQDWQPCPANTVVEDFYIPMRLLMQGRRVVFEPRAQASEDLPPALKDEFSRRIRIGAGDFQALSRLLPMLHPAQGLAAWVFFSHKVLRWFGPFFLLAALGSNLWLAARGHLGFQALLLAQLAFYALALAGMKNHSGTSVSHRLAAAAAHFVGMNAALFLGFFRWLSGTQRVTWNVTRRSEPANP
jgi:cellulose synthase/poly-beta-1,6-N-acetylglucosamine synthase-like glycosyltransferase